MPSSRQAGLRDYNEVADRVAAFNEDYPDGRIITEAIELTEDRVTVKASIYKSHISPEGPPDSTGHSWLNIPGTTNFTRGSELENAETSAVGRALAFIGYYAKGGSLASKQEISAKGGTPKGSDDGDAAATSGNSSSRRSTRSARTGSRSAQPAEAGLTEKQRGLLFSALRDAGLEGAQRKALVLMVTNKASVKQMNGEDLDKVLAVLDDPEDELSEGYIALAKEVAEVGDEQEDDG